MVGARPSSTLEAAPRVGLSVLQHPTRTLAQRSNGCARRYQPTKLTRERRQTPRRRLFFSSLLELEVTVDQCPGSL